MEKTVTVDRLLKESRRVLQLRRWVKGTENDGHGGVCAIGAFQIACRSLRPDSETKQKARKRLNKASGKGSIVSFNDAYHTRKDDVLHAFTRAIYRHY